jgi:hypothetical protein
MTHQTREVEDYTKPFLVMAFVILFMGLFTIWAVFSFAVSLVSGLIVHLAIDRLPARD